VPPSVLLYHSLKEKHPEFPLRWNAEELGRALHGAVYLKLDEKESSDAVTIESSPLIEVRHLQHCYGSFEALSDVEARFYKGTCDIASGAERFGKDNAGASSERTASSYCGRCAYQREDNQWPISGRIVKVSRYGIPKSGAYAV
jgi:hypothetical protein